MSKAFRAKCVVLKDECAPIAGGVLTWVSFMGGEQVAQISLNLPAWENRKLTGYFCYLGPLAPGAYFRGRTR